MFLLIVIVMPTLFFGTALTAKFVSWCLVNADLLNSTLTFGQGCWIAVAITVVGLASIISGVIVELVMG